ncbi:hypothetical protein [Kineosporia sp. A_224]|nr:hypothetical protein [Kineosporia sp. A_224]
MRPPLTVPSSASGRASVHPAAPVPDVPPAVLPVVPAAARAAVR